MAHMSPPRIEQRPARPYAAIRVSAVPTELPTVLPPLTGEVLAWLTARGVAPDGPELWRYLVIDMSARLTVEVGFPVPEVLKSDGRVVTGTLPGGAYVVTTFHGHPRGLTQATADLLQWAEDTGVRWDKRPEDGGEAWGARIEWYLTADEPDPDAWDTELAFLLAPTPGAAPSSGPRRP